MTRTRRFATALVLAAATALPLSAGAAPVGATALTTVADVPLPQAIFRATHNSYSGDNGDKERGSIVEQLDAGVRFIEYDVHDNWRFTRRGYYLGHFFAGQDVDHNGNPVSNRLYDWLRIVDAWSDQHPDAAPITLALDFKSDITDGDNTSYSSMNPAFLNDMLTSVFGSNLFRSEDFDEADPPTVNELRGRVIPLISGNSGTRARYKRDLGRDPAIAINGRGQVVEVHRSESSNTLWYWSGTYVNGRVTWLRHGRYDFAGDNPAVALNDNGDLVEVHEFPESDVLIYRVGRVSAETGEITWSFSRPYDTGTNPTVQFVDPAGTRLREIHTSENDPGQNWDWDGELNAAAMSVSWDNNEKTSDALYDKATSQSDSSKVHVWTGADGATPAETLRVDTDVFQGDLIRYQQVAFVEFQKGDSAELKQNALYYAAGADPENDAFITAARADNRLVRAWDFDAPDAATNPLASFPATNHPYAGWYETLLQAAGASK
ncbi:hypothetical protein HII36_17805 [Nonomuraea sp. NN258]|nr:hypothetical protein [Nonomuraea antri]